MPLLAPDLSGHRDAAGPEDTQEERPLLRSLCRHGACGKGLYRDLGSPSCAGPRVSGGLLQVRRS